MVSVMLYPCHLCVSLLMDLFILRDACLGMVVNLLLNVMEVLSVGGSARYSFHMCLCFCMSEVISSFRRLRAGLQVFVLLMLFLCMILQTMCSGKSLQLLCILPFGMFVKIILAVCMLVRILQSEQKRTLCRR